MHHRFARIARIFCILLLIVSDRYADGSEVGSSSAEEPGAEAIVTMTATDDEKRDLPGEATSASTRFDPVKHNIEGWKIDIDPALVQGQYRKEGERALVMLANHLQRIKIVVPPKALKKLQTIGIWIERDHPRLKAMQYHPSRQWLVAHGHDSRLTRKVHITQARQLLSRSQMLKHPAVVLHELAHGYHDQVLGFDDERIIAVFNAAKEKGSYEKVLLHTGKTVRHYGLSDHKEYFAEGTEAFFYRNDFYPFVRAELKSTTRGCMTS